MENNIYDIIIIGAGAAGLFAAANIENKENILIIEKNTSAGKKLLLTGNGKCNISNSTPIFDFFYHYNINSRKFLKKALLNYDNTALLNFFGDYNIKFKTDDTGRIIPQNANAENIRNILLDICKSNNIKIHYNETVEKIELNENKIFHIHTQKNIYLTNKIILATGGYSYPLTGSSGDGYKFAAALGHSIITPKPALSQIFIKDFQLTNLAGASLNNARIVFFRGAKKIAEITGEILITHKGISGIPVINISREIFAGDTMIISFVDNHSGKFQTNFKQILHTHQKQLLKSVLKIFKLQERIIEALLKLIGLENNIFSYQLTKEQKNRLFEILTAYKTTVLSAGDFNTAMVTSGGVALNEINPSTMESMITPNLYFIGEIMDIDGDSGGYNLQAAFSTAKLAANSIK